jgi:hypothetical protein
MQTYTPDSATRTAHTLPPLSSTATDVSVCWAAEEPQHSEAKLLLYREVASMKHAGPEQPLHIGSVACGQDQDLVR